MIARKTPKRRPIAAVAARLNSFDKRNALGLPDRRVTTASTTEKRVSGTTTPPTREAKPITAAKTMGCNAAAVEIPPIATIKVNRVGVRD